MRLRTLRSMTALVLLLSAVPFSAGCSDGSDGAAGPAAQETSPLPFADGGEETEEFQLALELMVFSHLQAYIELDELLSWVPSDSTESEWRSQYSLTSGSIARAQAMAAEFSEAVDALDEETADAASDPDEHSSLWPDLGVESAIAIDPDTLGSAVGMQLNYDGVVDPQQKMYTGPSQLGFQTGLVAEFDSLKGDKDRWQTLADRYNTSVSAISKEVSAGREFLQSNLDNDAMYADEGAKIASAVELGSDVALFALSGGGSSISTLVRRYGLRAAIAQAAAKEGAAATAVKAMQFGSIAIDSYELGTAVVFNESPGPMVTHVETGLGALQQSHTLGKLLLDPKTSMLDPGNFKTIKGWTDFLTAVPDDELPAGVFEVDGGLVAGPIDVAAITYEPGEALGPDEMRSMVPARLEELAPIEQYIEALSSEYAGEYAGSFEIAVPGIGSITVPLAFTVDDAGQVTGSWDHSTPLPGMAAAATYSTTGSFSGTAEDGLLDVSGTSSGTTSGPYNSATGSGPFTVQAPISDGQVSGSISGSGFGYPFSAAKK